MVSDGDQQYFVTGPEFARTYNPPSHANPWELVEEYQGVMDFAAANPTVGSTGVARKFDIPRGRVRPWMEDENPSRPDCVRGLDVAERHGWINIDPAGELFCSLNVLVAGIFSGGSINSRFEPRFSLGRTVVDEMVMESLDSMGVDFETVREDETARATEIQPTTYPSILGRVLSVLGAPIGSKNAQSAIELPSYLGEVEDQQRKEFARVYLLNRGHYYEGKDTVQFREERPDRYLDELAEFLSKVSGESVNANGKNIVVSAGAARSIGVR